MANATLLWSDILLREKKCQSYCRLHLSVYTWGKKQVLIGCKSGMFWRQTFEVWSRRLLSTWLICFCSTKSVLARFLDVKNNFGGKCAVSDREMWLKVVKNEIWAERADQKQINNLPLAWQFALTAVKLQTFGDKTRHVWHPITTCFFFVSCPRLDATDGKSFLKKIASKDSGINRYDNYNLLL